MALSLARRLRRGGACAEYRPVGVVLAYMAHTVKLSNKAPYVGETEARCCFAARSPGQSERMARASVAPTTCGSYQ